MATSLFSCIPMPAPSATLTEQNALFRHALEPMPRLFFPKTCVKQLNYFRYVTNYYGLTIYYRRATTTNNAGRMVRNLGDARGDLLS